MRRLGLASAAIGLLAVAAPAIAADLPRPVYKAPVVAAPLSPWFIEGRIGGSFGWFDDLKFLNPTGAAFTSNPVSGGFIVLNDRDLSDTSFTGAASVGYFFTNQWFVRASYQYFGEFRASGFANFPGVGNFRQDLKTRAHGFLVGVGADFNITNAIFVEPIAEIGVGFLHSTGQQGANLGAPNNFPTQDNTNFVAGGGVAIGYHATRNLDVLLSGNYYWLGRADTGVTGNPAPANALFAMNPGEQLQANLQVFTLTVGARARF